MRNWFALSLSLTLLACTAKVGSSDGGGGGDAIADVTGATLTVAPADATMTVTDGVAAEQAYTATIHYLDGSSADVTDGTAFSLDDVRLGSFSAAVLSAGGFAGGTATVRAVHRGVVGETPVTIAVDNGRVVGSAPAEAPGWFDAASDDPALAPQLVYPADGTMVPPNLGDFEVHWTDSAGCDVFEVALSSAYVDLRLYVAGTPNAGSWAAYLPAEWSIAGDSNRGGALTVTVRGLISASPGAVGSSAAITVDLTDHNVEGGIYYWAAAGEPYGIFRHDMARPGEAAEEFYTNADAGRCVACHVLSRDGTRMAITYDGGNGAAAMIDVASRTEVLLGDGSYYWNFATFEPDGERIITVANGLMTLRNSTSGASLGTVPTPANYGTHPDFNPAGDAIVYVAPSSPGQDWHFSGGAIITQGFDSATGTFATPVTLVASGAENNYYPSWSPDGEWIVFNKSTEDAYDDASAELWMVKADGTQAPFKLTTPNVGGGLTNSWGRWTPFVQSLGGETPEPFFWLTFSSRRAFGVRMAAGERPQIWMAPFFPGRVASEPSAPAFRLPFQDLASNNHIAQWTEEVVPID